MQLLIGCAKDMNTGPALTLPVAATVPAFEAEARGFARDMAQYSVDTLGQMLGVSPRLAQEVKRRYAAFFDDDAPASPAIEAYNGVVFKQIDVAQFDTRQLDGLQRRLWITSFLYGLLRPFDAIRPYRLEGSLTLPAAGGLTLFRYWQPRITALLLQSLRDDDGVLVDLASAEMRSLYDRRLIEREAAAVVSPRFMVERGRRLTSPSVWAKECRGAMTAWIIGNGISDPGRLREFSFDGFVYRSDDGPSTPVFVRHEN